VLALLALAQPSTWALNLDGNTTPALQRDQVWGAWGKRSTEAALAANPRCLTSVGLIDDPTVVTEKLHDSCPNVALERCIVSSGSCHKPPRCS